MAKKLKAVFEFTREERSTLQSRLQGLVNEFDKAAKENRRLPDGSDYKAPKSIEQAWEDNANLFARLKRAITEAE